MQQILQLEGVGKTYGRTPVLDDVSVQLAPGQCLALLGENGAGKSTLVKIISGMVRPTSGSVVVRGERRLFRSPLDSQRAGVSVVPQDLAYVPNMTVAENLVMGHWPGRFGVTNRHLILRQAHSKERALNQVGIELNLQANMNEVSLAERQLVEIAKALSVGAELLLLDEPTATLSAVEADRLLTILEDLKRTGHSLIYVTHHVDEAFRLADRVAVLRNGKLVLDAAKGDVPPESVITAMLGASKSREYERVGSRPCHRDKSLAFRVDDWNSDGVPGLHEVSFSAFKGEIVGVFGLVGSGAEIVAKGLAGHARVRGELEIEWCRNAA